MSGSAPDQLDGPGNGQQQAKAEKADQPHHNVAFQRASHEHGGPLAAGQRVHKSRQGRGKYDGTNKHGH
jgi:hypothetical protein